MKETERLGRERAAAFVSSRMAAQGLGKLELADLAGLDSGTIGDFLAGRRWPVITTQGAIETALGIDNGTLDRIKRGLDGTTNDPAPRPRATITQVVDGRVVEVDRPDLLELHARAKQWLDDGREILDLLDQTVDRRDVGRSM